MSEMVICRKWFDGEDVPFFEDPLIYGLIICVVVFIYLLISEIKSRSDKKHSRTK